MELQNYFRIHRLIIIAVILIIDTCMCSKIAIFVLQGSGSHKEMPYGIAEALVESGHEVTFYSIHDRPKRNIQGVREIYLEQVPEFFNSIPRYDFFHESDRFDMYHLMNKFFERSDLNCEVLLRTPQFQELARLPEPIYDVGILDILYEDCALPILHRSSRSIVLVSSLELYVEWRWPYQIPFPASYLPSQMALNPTVEMTFFERVRNAFDSAAALYMAEYDTNARFQKILDDELDIPGLPTIRESREKVALILQSANPAVTFNSPTSPMVKHIAGVHLKDKLQPLSKDLESFIEESGQEGIVFVNFGTIVPAETMPKHAKNAFIETFSKLPYKVVWRFSNTDNMTIPSNVKLVDWIPQETILAHPKTRVFLTHGGMNGYIETVNYGVPCVVIPVFADQPINALKMASEGMAVILDWKDLNAQKVLRAVEDVVKIPSYKENAVRLQKILRDRLVPPKQEAAYWIEYVIRHNGSTQQHLRIRADHLNLFQYLLLDVLAFVGTIVVGAMYLSYVILKRLILNFRNNNKNNNNNSKNRDDKKGKKNN